MSDNAETPAAGGAERDAWGSKLGFILAAAGSAVGLGNIWKFPYITGLNGGGLFVLIYLGCILLVGLPIMVAEIMIGRSSQRQPVAAFHAIQGKKSAWAGIGWLGVVAGFVILSFYVVVAGWAMDYTLKSVMNFTKPVAEEARVAAEQARSTAAMTDVRAFIVAREAAQEAGAAESPIKKEAGKSAWKVANDWASVVQSMVAGLETDPVSDATAVLASGEGPDNAALAADLARRLAPATDEYAKLERLRAFSEEAGPRLNQLQPELERRLQTFFSSWESARSRFEEVPERKAALGEILPLRERIATARDEVWRAKEAEVAARDEVALRDQYETAVRRDAIAAKVGAIFGGVATDGWVSTFWAAVIMLITILIVAGGVSGGIETACRTLMPVLISLICLMVLYGATTPGFGPAISFVFSPNADNLTAEGVLEALGHAFFTLSLGMGAMITYGSYQRTKDNLLGQSVTIAGLDTGIALLACMMMFPIVFSYGQEPTAGPGLVFISMPLAFAEIGNAGMLLAVIFFGLLVFAALTSSVSLLEVVGSYFKDEKGWSQKRAAWTIGGVIFLFAIPTAFHAQNGGLFSSWDAGYGKSFFDSMDHLASNWLLPLGGLFISIYAGWVMPKRIRDSEMQGIAPGLIMGWLMLVRFVAPACVLVVLAVKIGLLELD